MGECFLALPDKTKVIIKRNIYDLNDARVYLKDKYIGDVKVLEKIGYGYNEYTSQKVIEQIQRYKAIRRKKITEATEELKYLDAYIDNLLRKAKNNNPKDKIIVKRSLMKGLFEHLHNPYELVVNREEEIINNIKSEKDFEIDNELANKLMEEFFKKNK